MMVPSTDFRLSSITTPGAMMSSMWIVLLPITTRLRIVDMLGLIRTVPRFRTITSLYGDTSSATMILSGGESAGSALRHLSLAGRSEMSPDRSST